MKKLKKVTVVDALTMENSFKKDVKKAKDLNNINFKVNEGEFVAIMGQSGSGKSTMLYSISGMDRPTSGNVFLNGDDISKLDEEKLSSIYSKSKI